MNYDNAQIGKPTGFVQVNHNGRQVNRNVDQVRDNVLQNQHGIDLRPEHNQANGAQEHAADQIIQAPDNHAEVARNEVYINPADVEISSLKKQLAEGMYNEARYQELADKMFARFQSIMDDNDHKRLGGYERDIPRNK